MMTNREDTGRVMKGDWWAGAGGGGGGCLSMYMGGPCATSSQALVQQLSVSQQLTLLHVSVAGSVHMPAAMTLEAVNDQMAVMISLTMVGSCT